VGYPSYSAEAAILNFYGLDHSLMAHLDDVEETFEMPIVSLSFGNTAVFLIGDTTKETSPVAMFIRSGDVVIMSGHSRLVINPEECLLIMFQEVLSWCAQNRSRTSSAV
jgi:alkylated DNA repair protein alkB family protein 1